MVPGGPASVARKSARCVDDALLECYGRGLSPVSCTELRADVIDVIADREVADLKRLSDLFVGEPLCDHLQNLHFARTET